MAIAKIPSSNHPLSPRPSWGDILRSPTTTLTSLDKANFPVDRLSSVSLVVDQLTYISNTHFIRQMKMRFSYNLNGKTRVRGAPLIVS